MSIVTVDYCREDDQHISVQCEVDIVKPWRGSAMSCPSDMDYYGYETAEVIATPVHLTKEEENYILGEAIELAKEAVEDLAAEKEAYEQDCWKEKYHG